MRLDQRFGDITKLSPVIDVIVRYLGHHEWNNSIGFYAVQHELPRNIIEALPVRNPSVVNENIQSLALQLTSAPFNDTRVRRIVTNICQMQMPRYKSREILCRWLSRFDI